MHKHRSITPWLTSHSLRARCREHQRDDQRQCFQRDQCGKGKKGDLPLPLAECWIAAGGISALDLPHQFALLDGDRLPKAMPNGKSIGTLI